MHEIWLFLKDKFLLPTDFCLFDAVVELRFDCSMKGKSDVSVSEQAAASLPSAIG